jgi:hypothetical protein
MFIYGRWIGTRIYFFLRTFQHDHSRERNYNERFCKWVPGSLFQYVNVIRGKFIKKQPALRLLQGQEAHLIFLELCLLLCPPLLEEKEMLLQILHIEAGGVQLMAQLPVLQPGGITSREIMSSREVPN